MAHSRTIIALPDGHPGQTRPKAPVMESATLRDRKVIPLQGRMIVGVLYTVSRNLIGEIYPVYVGKNTIGSDSDCDICLRESSVYNLHATLLVRKLTDDSGKIHTSVSISGSMAGVGLSINGEEVDEDRVYCHSGDIIKVGDNYMLSLQLLSPETHGVTVSPGFDALPVEETAHDHIIEVGSDPVSALYGQAATYRDTIAEEDERSFYAPSKAKKEDHLSNKTVVED